MLAGGSGRLGSTSVTVPEPYWTASNVSPGRSTSTPAALPTGCSRCAPSSPEVLSTHCAWAASGEVYAAALIARTRLPLSGPAGAVPV